MIKAIKRWLDKKKWKRKRNRLESKLWKNLQKSKKEMGYQWTTKRIGRR